MALFGSGKIEPTIENSIKNKEEFEQLMIACELAEMDKETLQEFCGEDGLGEHLVTEGKLKNRTLVRLSKKDDLARRKKMACYQLAKEHGDPAWKKFIAFRQKAQVEEEKMFKKYSAKADKLAKEGQKNWLHGGDGKTGLLKKFGASDR